MSDENIYENVTPEQSEEIDCLPCQALDRLCQILPEEDGKKACEEIKIRLEDETMSAEEAREYLASKVGRHILATKLAEVSDWITEQELKRQQSKEIIADAIPLEVEPEEILDVEMPLPDEIEIGEAVPLEAEEEVLEIKPSKAKTFYSPEDEIIYRDLDTTDYTDDPAYMYDDDDVWLEDGLYDE